MKNSLVILASVLLVLSVLGIVYAATQQTVTASVSVTGASSITVNSTTLTFGSVGADDQNKTPTENPIRIDIVSNTGYTLKVSTNQTSFTGPGAFAASNLRWATTLAGTYTSYNTTDVNVASGISPGTNYNLFHRLTVPSGTAAGSYNLPITLKVTTP